MFAMSTSPCSVAKSSVCSARTGQEKTTCFYIIIGLIAADTGCVSLDGRDITELPMYRRARLGIGYLPQEASIFRGLRSSRISARSSKSSSRRRICASRCSTNLLAEFSITHLRRAPAMALSGGERRRCEIARALGHPAPFHPPRRAARRDRPDRRWPISAARRASEGPRHRRLITDHNVRETLEIVDRAYILHEGGC